jgi:hypothetical protein
MATEQNPIYHNTRRCKGLRDRPVDLFAGPYCVSYAAPTPYEDKLAPQFAGKSNSGNPLGLHDLKKGPRDISEMERHFRVRKPPWKGRFRALDKESRRSPGLSCDATGEPYLISVN